jgi:RAB protein geranylgeranyltransferase component A
LPGASQTDPAGAKVPATEMEAIKSPLLGLFEKRRARNFFLWVQNSVWTSILVISPFAIMLQS